MNGFSCSGDFVCTSTFGIRVNLELHLVAGRDPDSLLDIADVKEENTLIEDIVIAAVLFDNRSLLLDHLLDLRLNIRWQFAKIARFNPTVTLASLQNRTDINIIACLPM